MNYPLSGLKVLDFSRVLAGPYASRLLSDLGADVIKVEPPEGDVTRHFGHKVGEQSGFYVQQNVGKRNICIDLRADGARELIHKLVEKADVVLENFRPGVMDKYGIGWDDLHKINPKLVMVSISGFGQEGPERTRAAYAPILHAEMGIIERQSSFNETPPADLSLSLADTYSSLHGLVGMFAALRHAEQTGEGQHVDIAMINVVHSIDDYAHYALDGVWPKAEESLVWEAPEGQQILISGEMRWLWKVFSTRGGLKDPTPPGADLDTKIKCRFEAVRDYIKSFESFDALCATLDEVNLAWGRVRQFGEDSFAQPSVTPRGVIVEVDNRQGGTRKTVQSPYKVSHTKSGIEKGAKAPHRGEHNADALGDWLGISSDQVAALAQTGVLLKEDDSENDGAVGDTAKAAG